MKHILLTSILLLSFIILSGQTSEGIASYYDDKFEGRPTSNGEIFSQKQLTAAHRNLPYGTKVKVTNLENKKSVIVRINDRGPFVDSRIIDLTSMAAKELGFIELGMAKVKLEVISEKEGSKTETVATKTKVPSELHFPNEYYELDIKFAQPSGFAVQVGSFTELSNLMRMAQELRRIYGKNLIVQVTDVNEKKVHRLLVGPFSDRPSAEKMQHSLKGNFTDSFVVEIK